MNGWSEDAPVLRRAIVTIDDQGVVQSWDAGAEDLFGYDASDAVGSQLTSLVVPEWLIDAHAEGFARYLREGHRLTHPTRWTVPAVTADGSALFVDLDVAPIEVEGVHRTVGVIREAGSAGTHTPSSAALLEALFERAPEIITVVDPDGRQRNVNDAAARLLGYDPAMQVPPSGYSFVHPEDHSVLAEQRRRMDQPRGQPLEAGFRFRVLDAAGHWRWLEALVADLTDVPGVEARVIFSRDVTEAEEQRVELAAARAEAERQAENLRQFDQARNDFVASVSHEFRTPLTSLISGAELLLDVGGAPLDAETRETVELLQRNAHRLRRLVENLLLVSRLDAGMEELVPAEVDVGQLLLAAIEGARPAAEARDVRIELDTTEGSPLTGDGQQLAMVLENVVGNAVKYTEPGTTVRVEASTGEAGWTVDVRDHGPGVAADETEQIFHRFTRGSAARAGRVPGAGLGLAISRAVVELHGGTIEPVDTGDPGALFRISLPWDCVREDDRAP
jgi:PAS domain S-box-containing protein